MTQQEQHEFKEGLEAALSWMQAVQERLRAHDDTTGPRAALEARLRETEKIRGSEEEGRAKMDRVLVAADSLLQNGDEETKNQTHARLKDLKALWEETSTYITHCHSRIEWVWLHWAEYLKAHEEFELWVAKLRRALETGPEPQPGLREKLWQVDHHRVLLSDVQAQAQLLERLLDEGATLHSRTEDPSVDEEKQKALQEAYNQIQDKAKERLLLLQKMAEEHQQYHICVQAFQAWLVSKAEEVSVFTDQMDGAEDNMGALEELNDSVLQEENTLLHIECLAEAVRSNSSPCGAEQVTRELETLRQAWERLRLRLAEVHSSHQTTLDSENQYSALSGQLWADVGQLRALVQRLSRELENKNGHQTEEQLVALWRKHTGVRNALITEEAGVEELKARLKELFHFPKDSKPLSDNLLGAVKEYQSVKGRAFRLSCESEASLKTVLQDPLHGFSQWSQMVAQVLESSAEVTDFSHIALFVQNIEKLLQHSLRLQERLSQLQVKRDLLSSVFGGEKAESLLTELSSSVRRRELLHGQLLQRKSRLQALISRTKDFGEAYQSIRKKLTAVSERFQAVDCLQPDILAKKSQADQLKVIRKDLEDCEAHITALETLVSSGPANRAKFECLFADWKLLYTKVRVKVNESEQSVVEHEDFHDSLLNLEKWLMIMRQKLESFRGPNGDWSVENRQREAERALGEFPEKELQLDQAEAQGHNVLAKTSEEGKVHIVRDLKRLRESWMSLHALSLNLFRLLNDHSSTRTSSIGSKVKQQAEDVLTGPRPDGGDGAEEPPKRKLSPRHNLTACEGSGNWAGFEANEELCSAGETYDFRKRQRWAQAGHPETLFSTNQNTGTSQRQGIWRGEQRDRGGSVDELDSGRLQSGSGRTGLATGGGKRAMGWTGERPKEQRSSAYRMECATSDHEGAESSKGTPVASKERWSPADFETRRREFEGWLQKESDSLSGILSRRAPSAEELKIRQNALKGLHSRVPWGQSQIQQLLDARGPDSGVEDLNLEELRYRWMLYKSKLKDVGVLRARRACEVAASPRAEIGTRKEKNWSPPLADFISGHRTLSGEEETLRRPTSPRPPLLMTE
ncbi:nesprin-3 isoform X2 [Denticeps clupeoides]|uniref:Nesprin-3 n=1 Tax=Denticeps clupeoides TaxID=299321 RepID=A0AAY4ATT0_9TELE|nr:nesprin-3-like isoform X2 [Denticeps clupeoides]